MQLPKLKEAKYIASNRSQVASDPFECYRQRKVTFTAHKTFLNFDILKELKARPSKRKIGNYYKGHLNSF